MKETEYFIVTMSNPGGELSQVFNSIEDARKFANILPVEEGYRVAIHSNTETPMNGVSLCTLVHYLSLNDLRNRFEDHDLPRRGDIQYLIASWEDPNDGLIYLSYTHLEDVVEYRDYISGEYGYILPIYTNDREFIGSESYKTTQEIESLARELIYL